MRELRPDSSGDANGRTVPKITGPGHRLGGPDDGSLTTTVTAPTGARTDVSAIPDTVETTGVAGASSGLPGEEVVGSMTAVDAGADE